MKDWKRYLEPENQHPVAGIFPNMLDDDLNALAKDIKTNGQRDAVLVLGTVSDGVLVDGKNRLRACEIAGVEPRIDPVNFHYGRQTDEQLLSLVLSKNLTRRHLTPAQRSAAVVKADALAERLKERRKELEELESKAKAAESDLVKEVLASLVGNPTTGRKRERLAKAADVSPDTIALVQKIQKRAPERLNDIIAKKMSIKEASENLPPLPKSETKKKYPILPPPPVLPPTDPGTVKAYSDVQRLIRESTALLRKNSDLIEGLLKGVNPQNVEEHRLSQNLTREAEEQDRIASDLRRRLDAWSSDRNNPSLYAAACGLEVQKMETKPATYSYYDNYEKTITEAMKLVMAPLGYRKTMGHTFKRVDHYNKPPDPAPTPPQPKRSRKKSRKKLVQQAAHRSDVRAATLLGLAGGKL